MDSKGKFIKFRYKVKSGRKDVFVGESDSFDIYLK
jgi:hypothetical protein